MTGQTVCSCQYGPGGAALYNHYSRVPGLPEAFYNQAAMAAQAAQLQQLAAAADPSVLYGGMVCVMLFVFFLVEHFVCFV